MAWELIFWVIFLIIILVLIGLNLFQITSLQDVEHDYLNPYELSSRIDTVVVPEFVLQGILTALFLLRWHWIMFLISVPVTCYHVNLFWTRKHRIDVTEVFTVLHAEKKYRMIKLGVYVVQLSFTVIWVIVTLFNSIADEEDAVHLF